MSGAPCATRSPDFTKICVICPSICGWTVVERSDFNVATYSVVSSTGDIAAVFNATAVGGICGGPAAAPFWPPLQAADTSARPSTPANVHTPAHIRGDDMTAWTLRKSKGFRGRGTHY